ncbi:Nicotinamidase-related amidase [Microbulbifer donghaiensis]|uniref:Nicotinamidase-related amidase n=1 Tax=Microbulbifer donghaiensis TaxID=494016 RepID=A0A1M4UVY3_9GAMM|nr:hydrolase [Microbulbifer donghaiensis]SHE60854.1 Nicotinamidase-related amidase [Microbulbifer donghaiensis]
MGIISKKFKAAIAAVGLITAASASVQVQAAAPAKSLLTPDNHTVILIDHQPQMAFATRSHGVQDVRNNVTGLAKSAKAFNVPTILTTVASKSFSGPLFPELQAVFPKQTPIDRTTMNTWEDDRVVNVVKKHKNKKLVIAALWTEVCGVGPVLSAIEDGYDVYFVTDASGGVSKEAHDMAVQRMIQAGAKPITWVQYLLELQRDWARGETYAAVTNIAKEHAGGYGLGIIYAKEMFSAKEGQ